MDEPYFSSGTSSADLPTNPVRSELASTGRVLGTLLQRQFVGVQDVSLALDDVLHTAIDEGSDPARIASDLGISIDIVDYVIRGNTTWAWFLNRALHEIDNESE